MKVTKSHEELGKSIFMMARQFGKGFYLTNLAKHTWIKNERVNLRKERIKSIFNI